jgi:hypothetical protein
MVSKLRVNSESWIATIGCVTWPCAEHITQSAEQTAKTQHVFRGGRTGDYRGKLKQACINHQPYPVSLASENTSRRMIELIKGSELM